MLAPIIERELLYRLLARESDPDTALLSVFLLLAFPVSYFLTAVYSESLFLLLIVLFFYCLRNQKFFLAGIAGLFAALTRSVGLFLIIPLGMELFRYLRSSQRKSILLYLPLLLIPLGSGIFSTYLYAQIPPSGMDSLVSHFCDFPVDYGCPCQPTPIHFGPLSHFFCLGWFSEITSLAAISLPSGLSGASGYAYCTIRQWSLELLKFSFSG